MVLAPVTPGRERGLRELLATMNSAPGMADPTNAVLPFGRFERLHFARLAVLDDPTLGDIEAHGVPRPSLPIYLALIGSCDGPADECIADLARRAGAGLRRIFAHCDGFDATADLAGLDASAPTSARRQLHQLGRSHGAAGQGGRRTAPCARRESAARAARIGCAGPAAPARADRLRRCRSERREARSDATGPDTAALAARKAPASRGDSAGGPDPAAVPDRPVAAPDLHPAHEGGERRRDLPAAGSRGPAGTAAAGRLRRDATSTRRSARSSRDCFAAG